jgi:hypothetical protein
VTQRSADHGVDRSRGGWRAQGANEGAGVGAIARRRGVRASGCAFESRGGLDAGSSELAERPQHRPGRDDQRGAWAGDVASMCWRSQLGRLRAICYIDAPRASVVRQLVHGMHRRAWNALVVCECGPRSALGLARARHYPNE